MVRVSQQEKTVGSCILDYFMSRKIKSVKTFEAYFSDISRMFDDLLGHSNFAHITKEEIESLTLDVLLIYFNKLYNEKKEDKSRKYSNKTINRKQAAVRSLFKYLVAREVIEYNLTSLVLLEKYNDTSEEVEMIPMEVALQYADYAKRNERFGFEKYILIKLALETAMRAEELLKLEWRQFLIEQDGVAIISKGSNKGKGQKEYLDKISKEFYEEVLKLKMIGNTETLFTVKYRTIADMMTRLNKTFKNENKGYTFHSFKKTAVTMVYLMTNCIVTAQKKARHKDLNTTRKYLRIADTNITGVISNMMSHDEDLYKQVDLDILIACIDKARWDVRLLLNNIIKEQLSDKNKQNSQEVVT